MPRTAHVERASDVPTGTELAVRSVLDLVGNTPLVEIRRVR
jgi:hypothetical protein